MIATTDAAALTPGLPIDINYFIKGYQDFGHFLGHRGSQSWYTVSGTVISLKKTGTQRIQLVIKEYQTGEHRTIRVDSDDAVRVYLRPLAHHQEAQMTPQWIQQTRQALQDQRKTLRAAPKGYTLA